MKFCKDCKYGAYLPFRRMMATELMQSEWVCAVKISPVTGDKDLVLCDFMRITGQDCGPDGLLWEERTKA